MDVDVETKSTNIINYLSYIIALPLELAISTCAAVSEL